jgi:hypothetical protein
VRFLGRGVGATASGMSSVVQTPVRAARGLRHRDTAPAAPLQPEPQPEPPKKRTAWDGLLENRDRLVENVKGGLDSAKELLPPLGGEATPQQLLRRCFPARLQHAGGSGTAAFMGSTHDLAASGTRLFGLAVGPAKLQVKIYEFALYLDAKQAKGSQLSKQHVATALPQPQLQPSQLQQQPSAPLPDPKQLDAFAGSLRSARDIDMSLVVRASRGLPLRLMAAEYERILKRRLRIVGGSPDDPALGQLLAVFRDDRLPEGMVRNGNVQKDSVLTFTRAGNGRVTAAANGTELTTVNSPAFAAAVFDLYVGDQPVSSEARTTALLAAQRMIASGPDGYAPAAGQPGVCQGVGSGGSGDACKRRWPWEKPWHTAFSPAAS